MKRLLDSDERVVIIGAGPTGLGAAHRLVELGHEAFQVYEASDRVGGLATSYVDSNGFVWDLGGHVQFSHYQYFQDLMDALLGDDWLTHERVASIQMAGRLLPYPLQYHLRYLPDEMAERCRASLLQALASPAVPPANFREWIMANFGEGIAEVFMLPYNFKVWAYPAEQLAFQWIGERVAQLSPERIAEDVGSGTGSEQGASWGPNRTFRFPMRGGTGAVWQRLASRLPRSKIQLNARVVSLDVGQRQLTLSDGLAVHYDRLISTMPVDELIALSSLSKTHPKLRAAAEQLLHSSVHVIGIGLHGAPSAKIAKQCWMYFPEDNCPFYRATVFSNYSPHNVPSANHWSLMLEVAESPAKPVDEALLEQQVINGLLATGLVEDRRQVASVWRIRLEHGYPTPSLGRDAALGELLPCLEELHIYSRGRFGAWKYEVSNQDHSLMQGVEAADRLLLGRAETTIHHPARVNAPGLRPSPSINPFPEINR